MSDLESTLFFPTLIYTSEKREFLKKTRQVVNEFLSKNTTEMNELYPVKMTESLEFDDRMLDFSEYVGKTAYNILVEQGCDMTGLSTFFTELWCQEHYKYSLMEQHVHGNGSQIVGFYFIDVPKDTSFVVFHDPRPGKIQIQLNEAKKEEITSASNSILMKPEEGLFIFSNAWLPHSFTRNGSDQPLRFIHFNLGVTVNANPQHEVEVI